MKNSWLLAKREIRERIQSRSFVLFSIFGPLVVLGLVYLFLQFGGQKVESWKVLIADPGGIMQEKLLAKEDKNVNYHFANGYIETEEFAAAKKYQQFDALVEVNEKILKNKVSHVFYRKKPTSQLQAKVQYQVERRIEEIMVQKFTNLSVAKFREVKQPIQFSFRNVYDPEDTSSDLRSWVGFFFGLVIFVFVALFSMTVLRSVAQEKSSRIVEVLLASVKSKHLLAGKIIGIGITAFFQFVIWIFVIGLGLYLLREFVFVDAYSVEAVLNNQSGGVGVQTLQDSWTSQNIQNEAATLIFERINFSTMLLFFFFFFVGAYLFYGSLFAGVGAATGTESDGQQFIIPLLLVFVAAIYSGYIATSTPEAPIVDFLAYLPFTSPIVIMVKLATGYETGNGYEVWLSLVMLFVSAFIVLSLAGKLYKNGLLQFGHRVRLSHIFRWMRK